MRHPRDTSSLAALFASVFILSQAGVLVRLSGLPPEVLGFWRMVLVVAFLGVILRFRGGLGGGNLRELLRPTVILAGVFFFLHFLLWFNAVLNTRIANAVMLFCLNPLFIAVGAVYFLREPFSFRLGVALVTSVCGVLLVELPHLDLSSGLWRGDLLALGAALMFAAYALLLKKVRHRHRNLNLTLIFNIICLMGFAILVSLRAVWTVPATSTAWLALFGLAIGPSLLGHALFSFSLKSLPVGVASSAVLLEPFFAAVAGYILFSEAVSVTSMLGFVVIVSGLIYLFRPKFDDGRPSVGNGIAKGFDRQP